MSQLWTASIWPALAEQSLVAILAADEAKDVIRCDGAKHTCGDTRTRHEMSAIARCERQGTVVVTAVTLPPYCAAAHELGASADAHGVAPCIVVSVSLSASCREGAHVSLHEDAWAGWAPSRRCDSPRCEWPCGYRQVWVLKTRLVSEVLTSGRDALVVDADWRFVASPLSFYRSLPRVAIIGQADRPAAGGHLINFGLMLIRSVPSTRRLFKRVANRSVVGWDQLIVNEELSLWSADGDSATDCCAANQQLGDLFRRDERSHALKVAYHHEGSHWDNMPFCDDPGAYGALAPPPLAASLAFSRWEPNAFNMHKRRPRLRCASTACGPPPNVSAGLRLTGTGSAAVDSASAAHTAGKVVAAAQGGPSGPKLRIVAHYKSGFLSSFQLLAAVCCTPLSVTSTHNATGTGAASWRACRQRCPRVRQISHEFNLGAPLQPRQTVVHFIRHPIDMLVSGTMYALNCAESWMRVWPPPNADAAKLAWGESFYPAWLRSSSEQTARSPLRWSSAAVPGRAGQERVGATLGSR